MGTSPRFDFQQDGKKDGVFEWLLGWKELCQFLGNEEWVGLAVAGSRVLVAGCGTSRLSADLHMAGYPNVCSVDYDAGCVAHLEAEFGHREGMTFVVADMSKPQDEPQQILANASYEMIVDKGTIDALLCVDSGCAGMLCEAHRMLVVGGVYVVVSFHSPELLAVLLTPSALSFEVTAVERISTDGGKHITIARLVKRGGPERRVPGEAGDAPAEAYQEVMRGCQAVMDHWFLTQHKLLTYDRRAALQGAWGGGAPKELARVYDILFSTNEKREYSHALFLEDVSEFKTREDGKMTLEEALRFMDEMG